jgi:hypothetical protein
LIISIIVVSFEEDNVIFDFRSRAGAKTVDEIRIVNINKIKMVFCMNFFLKTMILL